jgi:hypothetical protein
MTNHGLARVSWEKGDGSSHFFHFFSDNFSTLQFDNYYGNTDFVSFDGTGSDNNGTNNYQQNNSRSSNQKWREDLDYGMFAINEGDPNGVRHRTIYRACVACKGTVLCGSCHGMGLCILCNGKGGMVTAGYGTYLSCVSCGQTGRCSVCRGTGKCNCANTEYLCGKKV